MHFCEESRDRLYWSVLFQEAMWIVIHSENKLQNTIQIQKIPEANTPILVCLVV